MKFAIVLMKIFKLVCRIFCLSNTSIAMRYDGCSSSIGCLIYIYIYVSDKLLLSFEFHIILNDTILDLYSSLIINCQVSSRTKKKKTFRKVVFLCPFRSPIKWYIVGKNWHVLRNFNAITRRFKLYRYLYIICV